MTLSLLHPTAPVVPATPLRPWGAPRRVALYSHDTQGLGHIRRNIALAAAMVAADPRTDVLLLTGAPEATSLPLPPNTDVITLPTLRKDRHGRYTGRALSAPLGELLSLRSKILSTTLLAFAPDLFVVDKVARGVDGELDDALAALRDTSTSVVLGLREILDTPVVARREWEAAGTTEAVRDLYDAVWVYGDPEAYDLVSACSLPDEVGRKVVHTGYLGRGRSTGVAQRARVEEDQLPRAPYVLCTVGGGQDGYELADAFVRAPMPAGHRGVVLTGPYMRPEARTALARVAAARPDVAVVEFVQDAERWTAGAAAVVSMAGYNSVCELLASGTPTLLVPRTSPRAEQRVRADCLARRGLVDVLDPELADPERLGRWLAGTVTGPPRLPGRPVDLDGLRRVPVLAAALLSNAAAMPGSASSAAVDTVELSHVAV